MSGVLTVSPSPVWRDEFFVFSGGVFAAKLRPAGRDGASLENDRGGPVLTPDEARAVLALVRARGVARYAGPLRVEVCNAGLIAYGFTA